MSEEWTAALIAFAWLQGILFGYVLWAPETAFKRGFIDGLTFKFLRH